MDPYSFVSELIGQLVWPAMIVAVLVMFRRPIARRVETLRTVSAGSFAAEFGKVEPQLDRALAQQPDRDPDDDPDHRAPGHEGADHGAPDHGADHEDAEMIDPVYPDRPATPPDEPAGAGEELARARSRGNASGRSPEDDPAGAVATHPGDAAFDSLSRIAPDQPAYAVIKAWATLEGLLRRAYGGADAGTLRQQSDLPAEIARAVDNLRWLRDQVAHGSGKPDAGSATAYVQKAQELGAVLQRCRRRRRPGVVRQRGADLRN